MSNLQTILFNSTGNSTLNTADYLADQGLDGTSGDWFGAYETGRWYVDHSEGLPAYHTVSSDSTAYVDFYKRDSLSEPDHILIVQPREEQENIPSVTYLAPGDVIYLRKGTEISDFTEASRYEDGGFTITRKGISHRIEADFEDGDWNDIEFKFVGKNFDFNDINRPNFEPTGKQTLTILNIKAKDLWDDITGPNQSCAKIVFKGTKEDDILIGNDCNNVLIGKKGDDILDGGKGNDVLVGGKGRDTFVVSEGNDVIVSFDEEKDRIDFGDLQYGIDFVFDEFTNPLGNKGVNIVFAE